MDSLVVFIIIVAFNIIAKSAQEKKKIEKAKNERAKQLKNNPLPNMPSRAQRTQASRDRTNKDRDIREILKNKREKEYYDRKQEYIDKRNEQKENYNSRNYNYTIEEDKRKATISNDSYLESVKSDNSLRLEVEGQELTEEQLEAQKEIKKGFGKEGLERKKLINAIIWAEILGEPKSIQNIKKSM